MRKQRHDSGFTLLEMLFTAVIIGLIIFVGTRLFSKNVSFLQRVRVRQKVMVDSRTGMDTMLNLLRNGKGSTMVICSCGAAACAAGCVLTGVPNSRVEFNLRSTSPSGATKIFIYLLNGTIFTRETTGAGLQPARPLMSNVTGLMFTGDTRDLGLVNVTLQMDVPLDQTRNSSRFSSILLPNYPVHMSETQ